MTEIKLPPLPEKRTLGWSGDRYDAYQITGYDEDDLEDYAREAITLNATITGMEAPAAEPVAAEQKALLKWCEGWPMLDKPARVGGGTFGVGVTSRLVVEAAQRQYVYAKEEEAPKTPDQRRAEEMNRRAAWDMLNPDIQAALAAQEKPNAPALSAQPAEPSRPVTTLERIYNEMCDTSPPIAEAVPDDVLTAIRRAGLTLLKTKTGYELRKFGPIEAQGAQPQPPHQEQS